MQMEGIAPDYDVAVGRLRRLDWSFTSANTGFATHKLHPYPAKFIPQIPNTLIKELSTEGETVADIFCGSGTALLEALSLKRHAIGIDANPIAVLISKAKTTPLSDDDYAELETHAAACKRLLATTVRAEAHMFWQENPFQSSAWRPPRELCEPWFLAHVVEELAEVRAMVLAMRSAIAQQLCKAVFSAIIVRVSNQDSDTRYVRRKKRIKPGDTVGLYLAQLRTTIVAVRNMASIIDTRVSCTVIGANILEGPETDPIHLVVTSPPYPNAYSYHLYHRTRLMWLGYDSDQFKQIEIGSHRKYSSSGANRATPETFASECEVMFYWLRKRLQSGRHACFVIGDSTIQGQRVDNSAIIARAGAVHGFCEEARIGRTIAPTRKAFNPKIGRIAREQILILKKA